MPALSIGFGVPMWQAVTAAATRGVVLPSAYYGQLSSSQRGLAFSVSGLAALDQVQLVRAQLQAQLSSGGSLAGFQRWAATANLGLPPARIETIFRNAVQQAYNAGQWQQFQANASTRPYLMFDAINDARVRPSHLALDGVIRPVGDGYWLSHSPQLGHNCRCRLISLSAQQALARGGVTVNPPTSGPDAGWGVQPQLQAQQLASLAQARQSQCSLFQQQSPVWCTGYGATMLNRVAWSARASAVPIPPTSSTAQAVTFSQQAMSVQGATTSTAMVLGPIPQPSALFAAGGTGVLYATELQVVSQYIRRFISASVTMQDVMAGYQAMLASNTLKYVASGQSFAGLPLMSCSVQVGHATLRLTFEMRSRALVLYNAAFI